MATGCAGEGHESQGLHGRRRPDRVQGRCGRAVHTPIWAAALAQGLLVAMTEGGPEGNGS
eukprot:5426822-Pyramimonas_sp.AAC.1